MAEQKFSDFTLNKNNAAKSNDKAPTLKGNAKVVDADSSETLFDVAAWGPKKASTTPLPMTHTRAVTATTPKT